MPPHVAPLPANPDILGALCAAGGRPGGIGGSGGALSRLVLRLGRETPDPWEQYRLEQQQEGEEQGEEQEHGQDGELEQFVEGGGGDEGDGGDPWTIWRRRRAAPRWSWGR